MPKKAKPFVIFWTGIRIAAVFLLWWNFLVAVVVNFVLDAVDGDILSKFRIKRGWYQKYDKYLDDWWYVVLFVYMLMNVERGLVFTILVYLFVWRMIGSLLFEFTNWEWLLMFFPNVFNFGVILWVLMPGLFSLVGAWWVFGGLLVFTLVREWMLHISKIDMTHFLLPFLPAKKW